MPSLNKSPAALERNRELQRKRNETNNAKRIRTKHGRILTDIDRARMLESRPFIGWDGEGYDAYRVNSLGDVEAEHRYMLFGASTGQYVSGMNLSTLECLDLMMFVRRANPDAFHIGFSFEYDVNMILKDLPSRYMAMLTDVGKVRWKGYTIKHVPHKQFQVTRDGITITIYDVFGFFHTSYIRALGKFNIGKKDEMDRISRGKAGRGSFTYDKLAEVISYWSYEISLLPPLMDEIRKACYDAGFYIHQWHGPGALASYALRQHGVNKWHSKNTPKPIQIARRLAYAGGRFQDWQSGSYDGPVYTADINSAYAFAVAHLPRLDKGHWRRIDCDKIRSPSDVPPFALLYIRYDARTQSKKARTDGIPFPLFHRDSKGNLTWPPSVENWYWSPEARTVAGSRYAKFIEGWEFVSDGSRPFRDLVNGAYERRLQLQHSGNYAERGYKWFLASIYGQFAQRVGWDRNMRTAPRSHCLEWAGYITSYCRASVYMAACDIAKQGGLISIDTDGVTSTIPFDVQKLSGGVGEKLGEWKLEFFSGILHWQNGIYWLRTMDGKWEDPKTRGIPRGSIGYDSARHSLQSNMVGCKVDTKCAINLSRTRFIGYRQSISGDWNKWRKWTKESVAVQFGGNGKGRHIPMMCAKCRGVSPAYRNAQMHRIIHLWPTDTQSHPHRLPWLAPLPEAEKNVVFDGIWGDDTL